MANFDDVEYYCKYLSEENRRTIAKMYVEDGAYMLADAYQTQKQCSDEEREIVERGAEGVATVIQVGCLIGYVGLALQIIAVVGKTTYKLARFVKRRL